MTFKSFDRIICLRIRGSLDSMCECGHWGYRHRFNKWIRLGRWLGLNPLTATIYKKCNECTCESFHILEGKSQAVSEVTILIGDAQVKMEGVGMESIDCVVTSPPYWGLRDYRIEGQLGLEPTPEEYVEKLVCVFRDVWRVLRKDGTVWLNLGDSYNAYNGGAGPGSKLSKRRQSNDRSWPQDTDFNVKPSIQKTYWGSRGA